MANEKSECKGCGANYDSSDYDGSGLCPPCSKGLRDQGVDPVAWSKTKKPVPESALKGARDK